MRSHIQFVVLTKLYHSMLSRQLDRIPFLPGTLDTDILPRIHLAPTRNDDNAPETFSGRLLQARLAGFWRRLPDTSNAEYDAIAAEERYEQFCSEFLASLPAAFALEPDEQWDETSRYLPLQRQMLHIAVFESLCQNYRGLMFCETSQTQNFPAYKQVLLSSQKKALAVAALKVLDEISKLHTMLGGSQTRFPGIVLPTFEAAVLLIAVCEDAEFPAGSVDSPLHTHKMNPLGAGTPHLTRERCVEATTDALARLRTLAQVSTMAEDGANALFCLLNDRSASNPSTMVPHVSSISDGNIASRPSIANLLQLQQSTSIATPSIMDADLPNDFLYTPLLDISPGKDMPMLVSGHKGDTDGGLFEIANENCGVCGADPTQSIKRL